MRRCLIVSPHFPPSTLAGVHRARHLAKWLPAHGWEPTVITVDPAQHVESLDPELRNLVPSDVCIVETGAWPVRLTAPFGLRGEIGLRAFFHLRAAIDREIVMRPPDLVLITGSPFYPMLLARRITRRFGIPVVLDLQDPWVSREGETRRRWSKGWLAHRLAVSLEPPALRGASWITSVSERQNAELAERYPWLDQSRMTAIPIGGDPDDLEQVRHCASPYSEGADKVVISYVGSAWPRAIPVLKQLFRGIRLLKDRDPALADGILFRFVGTSNQPGNHRTFRILPLARAAGVADMVDEQPARVPFLEAMKILAQTDVVLMFGSDEPHYTASKIYPAMMSGRPFLSIFHQASSAHAILAAAGGGIALAWTDNDSPEDQADAVADALDRIVCDPAGLGRVDPAAYAAVTARAVAGNFASVFERALDVKKPKSLNT